MAQSGYIDLEVIVLTKEGVWIADGSEISHVPTRKLFARSLQKDSEGYFLSIGRETKRIEVEDTAYFVERIEGLEASLSDGTVEKVDPTTLAYKPGRLTMRIKNGTDEAKFLRGPYYEILRDLEEDHGSYYLKFNGKKVLLSG
jgi:hypothetical protein